MMSMNPEDKQICVICGGNDKPSEIAHIRSNVRRIKDKKFHVWRCASCRSLHSEKIDNLDAYYQMYPIRNEKLDYFWRIWYGNILHRLIISGLQKDQMLLDYGCNTGIFLDYLKSKGFHHCQGFDPYVKEYSEKKVLDEKYDFITSLDVIEHDENPREFLARLSGMLKPGGILCIETPNAQGIDLNQSEIYLHAIHMPYHTHILSQSGLIKLAGEQNLNLVRVYNRWYMDSWMPATSRHLAEKLLLLSGNDIDAGYEPPRIDLFFKNPSLFIYLLFGYYLPPYKSDHMMLIFRKK